jgi:hypothetical protein
MPLDQGLANIRNLSKVNGATPDVPQALFVKGSEALALYKGLKPLEERVDALKETLRSLADSQSYHFNVPAVGSVRVDRPGSASNWLEWEAVEEKINALTDAQRKKLVDMGVITRTRKSRAASKAKVILDLNA